MPAVELTVVRSLLKREAQGEKKKLQDSALVPITANPFGCRESGDPLLARSDYTELCSEEVEHAPFTPTNTLREEKVKNFHLSFVFTIHLPFQMKTCHFSARA